MPSETKTKRQRTEVWFSYRSKGSDTVHRIRTSGVEANRWSRKMVRSGRVDHVLVEGSYEEHVVKKSLSEARAHIQRSQSEVFRATKIKQHLEEQEQEIIASRVKKTGKVTTTRMSFHVGKLEQAVIILCPITGIIGKLEMPYCPVALNYEHPLAKPGNVLALLRYHFSLPGQQAEIQYLKNMSRLKLDRQALAGCLLSLLRGKSLLQEEQETNAMERNMVLQNAGFDVLSDLLKEIVRLWDNIQVWRKMPKLSVEWKSHASSDSTIAYSLQNYLKILKSVLDPISELSKEEQAKLFESSRSRDSKAKGIRIYSASAVEQRKIKEAKTEAYDLFEVLKPHLSIVHRALVTRTIRNLLLLPDSEKSKAATLLRVAFLGKPQQAVARDLANTIEATSNEKILSEIGLLSQEVMPRRAKSIAEILENKRQAKEEGEQNGE